jgi:hypothetical protein
MIEKINKKIQSLGKKTKRLVYPMNEPTFLILGAQKAGTTSLHDYLEYHPMLSGGIRKELCYFHRDIYFGKSYSSYKRDFCGTRKKIYFEATPEYLTHPGTAQNIYEKLPNVRMIVLLREPIKRAYSAWNHYRQHFETGKYISAIKNQPRLDGNLLFQNFFLGRSSFPSFRECIDIELELINKAEGFEPALLRRGLYLKQLEAYWKLFDKNQILILGFKDLIENTDEVLNQVCSFVGAEEVDWSVIKKEPKNAREYAEPILENDRLFLQDFFAEPNRLLFEKIGSVNW